MAKRRRSRPHEERPDPIRRVVAAALNLRAEPPAATLHKHGAGAAATGAPAAGRTSVEHALSQGPKGFLQVLGPGLITGASDDDPSGIGTYSQAGSQFGLATLWLALFTFPLMVAVQEVCSRIALHTGVGLGVALRRRFPTAVVGICILAVFVANTINVGADLGAVAAAGGLLSRGHIQPAWLVAPVALLIAFLQLRAAYATIFRIFKWLTLALFAYVITAIAIHPNVVEMLKATVVPQLQLNKDFIGIVVAILGTTISPYLFFWQASSEVEEMKAAGARTERQRHGVSQKELRAARLDVSIGMLFSQLVMYCIILTSGSVLHGNGTSGIQTASQAAQALQPLAGPFAFVLFSAGMIGTGLLAVPVLTGSAAYAVKEFLGLRGSLADRPVFRPTFYGLILVATSVGLLLNFLNINPIQALVVTAIINGMVAPPILVLIAILARDHRVMGERRSGAWSNTFVWLAAVVTGAAAIALVVTLF
jgi:NRAMP (natural resistance-associated macrophage protein)-like metal ion transporter